MSIRVKCGCGKKFKVKDNLAGKAVRCPVCKSPLRIPGVRTGSGADSKRHARSEARVSASAAGAPTSTVNEKEALARYEQAVREKQEKLEAEGAYAEERRKLIEDYDEKTKKQSKKIEKAKEGVPSTAPVKRRKVSIFTKIADAFGVVFGTLAFKYILIVVLLSGGVLGSIFLVQFVSSYMKKEIGPAPPIEQQIEDLFKQAEAALEAKKWGEARDALDKLIQLRPVLEKNRRYRELKARLDKGFESAQAEHSPPIFLALSPAGEPRQRVGRALPAGACRA